MYCESLNFRTIQFKGSVYYKSTKQHISTMWTEISPSPPQSSALVSVCVYVLSLSDDVLGSLLEALRVSGH